MLISPLFIPFIDRILNVNCFQALSAKTEGRVTGKQMFLQDKLLGISDLKLIENDKEPISEELDDKLVVDGVEVDASLFQVRMFYFLL